MPNDQGHKVNVALRADNNLSEITLPGTARSNIGAQAEMGLTANNSRLIHEGNSYLPEILYSSLTPEDSIEDSTYIDLCTPITIPANFWILGRQAVYTWNGKRSAQTLDLFRQVLLGGVSLFSQNIFHPTVTLTDITEQGTLWMKCVDDVAAPGTLRLVYAYNWIITNPAILSAGQIIGSTLSDEGSPSVLNPAPAASLALQGKLSGSPSSSQLTRIYSKTLLSSGI